MKLSQPQSIRTIFFDAGFTLLQPFPSTAEVCQRVCRQLDLHVDLPQMQQRLQEAEDLYFRQTRLNNTWAEEETINAFWIELYAATVRPLIAEHDERRISILATAINEEFTKHTNWQLFPDVLPTLQTLRARGYHMGVISDWGIGLGPLLRELHVTPYIDCLTVSALARYAKPSPHLYDLALQRANAIPDYSIHIGDSYIHDVLGARSVGIHPILLDRLDLLSTQKIDCPVVHSLRELLNLLEVDKE